MLNWLLPDGRSYDQNADYAYNQGEDPHSYGRPNSAQQSGLPKYGGGRIDYVIQGMCGRIAGLFTNGPIFVPDHSSHVA